MASLIIWFDLIMRLRTQSYFVHCMQRIGELVVVHANHQIPITYMWFALFFIVAKGRQKQKKMLLQKNAVKALEAHLCAASMVTGSSHTLHTHFLGERIKLSRRRLGPYCHPH